MKPARDVYLDHLRVWSFWMEHLKIKEPLVSPDICRIAVSDIQHFLRRHRDRPHPAKNGKGRLPSQIEFVSAAATDSFPQQILLKLNSKCARVLYFLREWDHKPFFPRDTTFGDIKTSVQCLTHTSKDTWLSKKAVRDSLLHHSEN